MNVRDALASWAVAVFLITLGLIGVMHWNSDLAQFGRGLTRLFGKTNSPVDLIFIDSNIPKYCRRSPIATR